MSINEDNLGYQHQGLKPRPAKRRPPRLLEVVKTQGLSESMQRISLRGKGLVDFPLDSGGAHIKLFLPREHQDVPVLPTVGENGVVWPGADEKPITRTYSVRHFCPQESVLDVDFVLHGDSPASGWAAKAQVGDNIGIAGPGGPDPLLAPAEWHILAGDLTALPAISALIEKLPVSAQGHAYIEIDQLTDQIGIHNRSQLIIHWLLRQPDRLVLVDAVEATDVPEDIKLSAFIAGENSSVVAIRNYLAQHYRLSKATMYAVPYWRRGQNEETYHQQRHNIMDEEY